MTPRKAKLKLRDLGRLQLELDDAKALMDAPGKELHPIATAILGAVIVERDLEILLRSKFKRKDHKTWAMLTADNGPLNSFSSKIAVGHALGIYDEDMRNDLHIVRKIRNAFAHSKRLIHFDLSLIEKELRRATRSALPKKDWTDNRARNAVRYKNLCLWLSNKLLRIQLRRYKSKSYRHRRRAMSPLALAALFTPPPGGKDK